jgi:predicted PurR-regulated permease PerM
MLSSSRRREIIETLLIAIAIIAVALLLWTMRGVLILVFGAILLAVILRITARPIKARLHLPDQLALLVAIALVAGVFVLAFALFGQEMARQWETLRESIPSAWQGVFQKLEAYGFAEPVRQWLQSIGSGGQGVLSSMTRFLVSFTNAMADTLLVIFGGIYLALDPSLYRRGLTKLLPQAARPRVTEALDDCYRALRLWLFGRLTSMALVGLLTGLGLWAIGMPAALTLGIAAGILDFVPFVGPIIAAIPAILLALATSPTMALWVILLYLLIQQIEGNIITPLIQKRAVELPPALLLFSLVALGLLFGVLGVILAEPLTVVIYVLVKRLYVVDALDTPTHIPGDESETNPGKT